MIKKILLLTLALVLNCHVALACPGVIRPGSLTVGSTFWLLSFWLFSCAVYFIIRGLYLENKGLDKQNIKTTYFMPALVYLVFLGSTYFAKKIPLDKRDLFDVCYFCFYALFVIYCCGYQVWAYSKQYEPKKRAWICPLIPFYIIPLFLRFVGFHDTVIEEKIFYLLAVICILIIYGNKSKTSKKVAIKIAIWGILGIFACVYSACVLYKYYTFVPKIGDCM